MRGHVSLLRATTLRKIFSRLNAGDHAYITSQFHPRAEHWFAGRHALSGKRTSHARIEAWYARLEPPRMPPALLEFCVFYVRALTRQYWRRGTTAAKRIP